MNDAVFGFAVGAIVVFSIAMAIITAVTVRADARHCEQDRHGVLVRRAGHSGHACVQPAKAAP